MNEQDLKNSILQLAIQGKLVEQREEEGTAKELLEKISIEKERLVKEKKIRKEKPLPKIIEDDINFDIPESWEWTRITNIADLYTGNSIPKSIREGKYSKVKEGYDYIATKDVEFNNVIKFENGIKIPYEEEKFKYSYKDSILMCIEGGSAGRKIGILDRKVCFGNKLCSFNSIIIEPIFLYYYLQSPQFINVFKENMTGIIGGVSITKLKAIILPIPPLEEQKRIVAKIEELMPYAEKYGEAYSKVEELNKKFPEDMQKSILQYAVQGKLVEQREEEGTAEELYGQIQDQKKRLVKQGKIKKQERLLKISENEILFDIPETWMWVRFGDIFQINPRNNVDDDTKVSFMPMTLLEEGYQSKFTYDIRSWGGVRKGYTHFSDKDIVMAKITPCFQNLKSAIMENLVNGVGAGTTELHVLRSYSDISLEFFLWFIKSPSFISTCVSSMTGTAGQQRVGTDTITNYVVPLPPFGEQKRIVAKIEEMLPYAKQLVK